MAIEIGQQLGSHEIIALLGKGGMGEVYRARDSRLKREVAIKILPDEFSHDPERVSRFQREAEVLAALNHPNIASIYDLQEENGFRYLVLELVEGETVADTLKRRGPLPVEETVQIAKQLVDALEAAHERGIVHRDLKPANIKRTPAGVVKVLDFGLAKALGNRADPADLSNSPTLVSASMPGTVLGTAGYMAPEQARGKSVDARADTWAFGCILYEMLTAREIFEGESTADIIAKIVAGQPNWELLPAETPSSIRMLLDATLTKNPVERLRNIADARVFLNAATRTESSKSTALPVQRTQKAWFVAAGLAIVLAVTIIPASLYFLRPSSKAEAIRFEMPAPGILTQSLFISPDGQHIAYVAITEGKRAIWIRPIGAATAQSLAGTENADLLFWSPDSRYLGFFADGKLKKIAASGGPTTVLSDAYASTYASWGHDGTILAGGVHPGIARFSELGGQVTALTNPDSTRQEVLHAAPKFLPDGRHFLFHAITSVPQQGTVLYVGSLDSKSTTRVMSLDSVSRYVAPGYLLFLRNRNLMAQLFDTNRQAPIGEPFALAENVAQNSFSASENGVLVYRTASTEPVRRATNELLWFDRKGNPKGQAGSPSNYARPMLSRDGRRVAVDTSDSGNRDIWVIDLNRTVDPSSRLTFNPDSDTNPVWAPDGSRIVFASNRGASLGQNLYQKSASGVGTDDLLLGGKADELAIPQDWSSDGQYIVFLRTTRVTLGTVDIWALPVRGDKKPFPLLESSSRKVQPQLSPDGRWLAYSTNESGTHQVVVQPFPDVNKGKWQVTTKGGIEPRWRRDGRELFYLGLDGKLMAVATKGSGGFEAGPPMSLFQTTLNAPINPTDFRYDVAADGQRFLINSPIASPSTEINSPPITVVINWTATLKK